MEKFSPKHIRAALDKRDGNNEGKRAKAYGTLSQYGSHATYKGFRMNVKESNVGELGPFISEKHLRAFLEETALQLGPASVPYGMLFPGAPDNIVRFREAVAVDLVAAEAQYQRSPLTGRLEANRGQTHFPENFLWIRLSERAPNSN